MPKCWAAEYSQCGDHQSREHIVSRGLFGESEYLEVEGFPWCKTPKRVGLDAVTRKMLCRDHNSALSDLDQAAKDAFNAFRDMVIASKKCPPGALPTEFSRSVIDALGLERWFLKTLINLSFDGSLLIGLDGPEPGRPSRDLLSIVYGDAPFPGHAGMYVASGLGQTIESKDVFQCAPLIHDGKAIVGALFKFRGLHAAIALYPDGPGPEGFAFNPHVGAYWGRLALLRPFDRIDYAPRPQFIAHEILFDWGGRRPVPNTPYLTHEEVVQRFVRLSGPTH